MKSSSFTWYVSSMHHFDVNLWKKKKKSRAAVKHHHRSPDRLELPSPNHIPGYTPDVTSCFMQEHFVYIIMSFHTTETWHNVSQELRNQIRTYTAEGGVMRQPDQGTVEGTWYLLAGGIRYYMFLPLPSPPLPSPPLPSPPLPPLPSPPLPSPPLPSPPLPSPPLPSPPLPSPPLPSPPLPSPPLPSPPLPRLGQHFLLTCLTEVFLLLEGRGEQQGKHWNEDLRFYFYFVIFNIYMQQAQLKGIKNKPFFFAWLKLTCCIGLTYMCLQVRMQYLAMLEQLDFTTPTKCLHF